MKIRAGLTGLAMLVGLAACDGGRWTLTDRGVGAAWPFTVSKVKVVCAPTLALFVTADGRAYPLNGQAERHPELYGKGRTGALNDILKVDPVTSRLSPNARMPLTAVTSQAIAACASAGKWEIAKE